MNENLTKEEEKILNRIESTGRWEYLFHDLAYFVPCAIIIFLGVVYKSFIAVFIGLITYAILRLWTSIMQSKQLPLLKSGIEKLKRCQQVNTVER
jgi:hypothetical protein